VFNYRDKVEGLQFYKKDKPAIIFREITSQQIRLIELHAGLACDGKIVDILFEEYYKNPHNKTLALCVADQFIVRFLTTEE
jgi:hypothetical protein